MNDPFTLPVVYKNETILFDAELIRVGYIHRVSVLIDGQLVLFEPDEERNYRAITTEEGLPKKEIDRNLLQAIVETLEHHFKS